MLQFLSRVYQFNRRLFSSLLSLSLAVSICEGGTIVAILPFLALTGLFPLASSSHPLVGLLHSLGITHLELKVVLIIFILFVSLTALLQRSYTIVSSLFQQKFNTELNVELYRLLAFVPWSFWLKSKTSDINHIVNNEIGRVSLGCYFFFQLITALFMLTVYVCISFMIAPLLTLIITIGGLSVFLFLSSLVKRSRRAGLVISEHSKKSFFALSEHLSSLKITKTYGLENYESQRLVSLRRDVEKGYLNFIRTQSFQDLIYKIIAAVFISGIFYIAIDYLHLSMAKLILVVVIFSRLWPRISMIQNALHSIALSIPAFHNIIRFENEAKLAIANATHDLLDSSSELKIINRISCHNVSYHYTDQINYVLKNITLEINHGELIGCVGVSGSGKSTLADLLLGLITPQQGSIAVNGIPLAKIYPVYQNLIGYVTQDVLLFNSSIRDNLLWSTVDVKKTEIWKVLKLVQLDKMIMDLPLQLDSLVGERGCNLSGGERQRLLLARTLLRKPQFLILDEATSALDEENAQRIQDILLNLKGQLIILVITHRTELLANADRVVTISNGNIFFNHVSPLSSANHYN
jgi:ATP-binding cassette subfamily C protein